jgi:hypothetical protein
MTDLINSDDEKTTSITINGKEYELIYTLLADMQLTKKIKNMNIKDGVLIFEDDSEAFEHTIWTIVLLANQSVLRHNLINPDDKKDLLSVEEVELFADLSTVHTWVQIINNVREKGMSRNIKSINDSKKKAAKK